MIKTRILALAAAATVALASVPSAQAQNKMGILDMNRIFTEFYKTKDAEQKLNEQRAAAKKEFDDRVETLKKSMEEINKLNAEVERPELSQDAKESQMKVREEKVNEARNLDREINDFRATREQQLQEQFVRMRKDIIEDIMKIVNVKVSDAGYDLVFDKSGLSMGQVPVVVYAREDMDFSTEIIKVLNESAPKTTPAAAPAN